jgi:hypothetical protein
MSVTRLLGGSFAALMVLELIGYQILQRGAQAQDMIATAAERPALSRAS